MTVGSLETRDLKLVQAIAQAGGATQAAKQLHLSQSAVSHQLRGLEQRLGLPLFERRSGRLCITPAGERLVALAHQVLLPLLQTELELKRGRLQERRKLRVATQCYTAYHWLPQALLALMAEHPQVELVLQSDIAGSAEQHLEADEADLVLSVTPSKKSAYSQVRLFEDELVLAVARGHSLARKPYVAGKDLAQETLIQNTVSERERERVKKLLFRPGEGVKRVLRLPVTEAVLDLVQAGLGVSILASFTLSQRVARGELAAVRLTRRGVSRTWTGVFRKGSTLESPIRTLLDTLKRQGAPHQHNYP
jgi:LysR family transcriptional regulator, regulator for metE and metH